ncbi:MAG: hypothetical protein PUC72_00715 [Bacteroidales bacterium]|nr:hypothetical protein [Bacteroidales bacterium]
MNDDALKRVARKYVLGAIDYAENGNQKQETDIAATKKKIDERINKDAYEKWVEDMFSGIVEKRGIRNQTDMFTPTGNRRAWESLYDEVTLDNVVKAMSKAPEKGGSGIFNGSIFGAASGEFKSIDEIRAAAQERIQSVDPDEMEKERQAILDRLSKVKVTEKELGIGEMFDLTTNIKDAVAQSHTPEGIHKYLKEYYPDMTMQAAQEIADIVKDIQKLSTKYFEAKPYRAVGFDEVKLAVVPEGTSQDVIDNLRQRGIEVRTYEAGNQQQRKEIVDQAAGELSLKFDKTAQGAVPLTEDEAALRDTLVDTLNASGIETISDTESGQRVLDKANGLERQAKKKALETASLDESRSLTVVSSADGAKVLKNIDDLQQTLQESTTQPKTFIGDVAMALGAKRDGSGSEYATFETVNGKIVTIRLSNHNAKVSNFDNREEAEGISIVISPKPNQGMINDGNAHIVEYYYNAIKLRKAEGKPLADIVKSIKQALYSGEFKDTTGLAKRKEVNESNPRLQKVYHGSGANFNAFDHKYMGSGEGTQAYGYGTYVTEVEGIGKHYANVSTANRQKENRDGLIDQKERLQAIRDGYLEKIKHYEEMAEKFAGTDREKRHKKFAEAFRYMLETGDYKYDPEAQQVSDNIKWRESQLDIEGKRLLYSVEIPDDNGENYIPYERTLPKKTRKVIADAVRELPESELSRDNHGPNWLPDGWNTLANTIEREQYAGKEIRERLLDAFGDDKKVSELLSKIGFVGYSVPTNYRSIGKTDASKNYVVFNEKDLKISDKVQFFKTPDGHAYGFTVGGKIYIDPRIASAETPIHEYAHLWAAAMRQLNPKEWENIVSLMKDTPIWESIKQQYPELTSDEEIADEVLANYSGSRGAQRLREAQQKVAEENIDLMGKARAISAIERVKDALKRFWNGVADFFGIHFTTAEEVADKIMSDMLNGVNPTEYARENNLKYAENSEEAEIVARAKADGTYMKAPNGKPTKLSPRQWVQVRTRAFKKWFGDWELAEKWKSILGLKAENISSEAISEEEAERTYLQIGFATNARDKKRVEFVKNTFGKIIRHKGVDTKLLMPKLSLLFENAIPCTFETEQPKVGHKDHTSNFVGYHHYINKISIDGVEYYVRFTVQEIRTNPSKQKKEGFTPYQLHSSSISDVKIYRKTDGSVESPSTSLATGTTGKYLDAKLEYFFEKAKNAYENSSKVVDENGEPMVVYHGFMGNDFNVFDKDIAAENTRSSQPVYGAFFFSDSKENASAYGTKSDKGVRSLNGIKEVFLKADNPYIVDANGKPYHSVKAYFKALDTGEINWARGGIVMDGYKVGVQDITITALHGNEGD